MAADAGSGQALDEAVTTFLATRSSYLTASDQALVSLLLALAREVSAREASMARSADASVPAWPPVATMADASVAAWPPVASLAAQPPIATPPTERAAASPPAELPDADLLAHMLAGSPAAAPPGSIAPTVPSASALPPELIEALRAMRIEVMALREEQTSLRPEVGRLREQLGALRHAPAAAAPRERPLAPTTFPTEVRPLEYWANNVPDYGDEAGAVDLHGSLEKPRVRPEDIVLTPEDMARQQTGPKYTLSRSQRVLTSLLAFSLTCAILICLLTYLLQMLSRAI